MYCNNTKCPNNQLGLECTKALNMGYEFNCTDRDRTDFDDCLKECARCIHEPVCKTAESCDGYVWECPHYKECVDWIPASNPPKEDGCYLVAVKNDHQRRYSKTAWYSVKSKSWFARQDVTHWMPLPITPDNEERK